MINEDPNMGRKQIFTELPLPSKVEEKGILTLIYKGVFIAVKLLLDIRLNLVKISEGKTIKTKFKQVPRRVEKTDTSKPENGIKGLDNIKIEEKPSLLISTKDKPVDDSGRKPYEKEDKLNPPKPEETKDETQKSDKTKNTADEPSEEK